MSKTRVLVLGASGMLGSMVTDVLAREPDLEVIATVRTPALAEAGAARVPEAAWRLFQVDSPSGVAHQLAELGPASWIINAIGLTKPYTHDDNPLEVERAVVGNALFPFWLARAAAGFGGRVLQIATDCVFSGRNGGYGESSPHDPLDVYGKTKSLGEAGLSNVHCLRCSIIGPEPKAYVFLLEWFRRQPPGARVAGFTNHLWNGVTTLHFARLCLGIIRNALELPRLQHVIPARPLSKYELLCVFARAFQRPDIVITPAPAPSAVNRTLRTENPEVNAALWQSAGYPRPPEIPAMVMELAAFDYRLAGMAP